MKEERDEREAREVADSSAVISVRSETRLSVAVVDTAFHIGWTKWQRNRCRRRYNGRPRASPLCHAHEMKFVFLIDYRDCEWDKRDRVASFDRKLIISVCLPAGIWSRDTLYCKNKMNAKIHFASGERSTEFCTMRVRSIKRTSLYSQFIRHESTNSNRNFRKIIWQI